jgi:S1-C subfamily serine protease
MFARAMPAMPALPEPPPGMAVTRPFNNFSFALNDEIAGMELATITPELGRYFGTDKGVLVVRAPDRTSFKLQDGDVIMAIGGREPKNGSHATRILRSYQPGEKIELKVMRQQKTTNLEVELPEDVKRTRMMGFDPPERGAIEIFRHHSDVETL